MTAYSITPSGPGEFHENYADYARGMKARGQLDAQTGARMEKADPKSAGDMESMAWGEDGFTFGDVLDIINPLQHIPVISDIYRAVTGDEIAPAARLTGSGLLGGIPGLAIAAVNTVVKEVSGQDIGEMAVASLLGDTDTTTVPATETAIAAALPAQQNVQGAAAGTSASTPLPPGEINFFNMRAAAANPSASVVTAATNPPVTNTGAIQNKIFTPLPGMPNAPIAAAESQVIASAAPVVAAPAIVTSAVERTTPKPAVTNLALANQTVTPDQITATQPRASLFADNGLTPAQQQKANRAALLAAARDLRNAFQAHSAYQTQDRLSELQASQSEPGNKSNTQKNQ